MGRCACRQVEQSRLGRQADRCVDNRQDAFLKPESVTGVNIKDLLTAASRGCTDREVLLCWRGTIPREAFEIIAGDGHVVARELPDADSNQRFAPVATQSCAGRALTLNDAANLPPQVVSQPPVVCLLYTSPSPRDRG